MPRLRRRIGRRRFPLAGVQVLGKRAGFRWRRWLLLGLMLYIGVIMAVQEVSLVKIRRERAAVARELSAAHERNRRLWQQIRALRTDAYIEKAAREELGLTRPGEILYLPALPRD